MNIRTFIIILLFCTHIRFADAKPPVSENEKQTILSFHNIARSEVGSPDLKWDDKIASASQGWTDTLAKKNIFEHSSQKTRSGRGENIYMISGDVSLGLTSDGSDAIASWTDEQYDYDISNNTCSSGKVCGHYTQVIWKSTKKVGCGKTMKKTGNTTKIYWVCQYDPAGNIIGKSPL